MRKYWRPKILLALAAIGCIAIAPLNAALSNPIGGGATLSFANGGTLSGFFEFNPATQSIASWNFTSTAFGSHVYNSSNTADGASSIITSNSNNNEVFSFFQVFQDGAVRSTFELDIVMNCLGVANCVTFGAQNLAFGIVGGFVPCAPGEIHCVSSGEQRPNAFGQVFLNSGTLNVSDPPGTLSFNVATNIEAGFTPFTGTGGGGGPKPVPEPASLLLFAAIGLAGGARGLFKRRQSVQLA